MQRILLSLALVSLVAGVVYVGATRAFFSDTETSTGNTFAAGAIDLKIGNESYYNGLFNEPTSWSLDDLTVQKFFDFSDVKPADYGEDTIGVEVNTNDAYLCADVTLTSNNENGCNEPEAQVDQSCDNPGPGQGELAQNVNFIWWADANGDNVLEDGENVISSGPIGALPLNQPYPVTLADSSKNIWNDGEAGGPLSGNTEYHIGKAWCFGAITPAPLSGSFENGPAGDNNNDGKSGTPEDGGYHCDGSALGNETQTDSLTADVSFNAVQARHNDGFLCAAPPQACTPSTTNIFVNGGFETPVVASTDLWDVFPAAITGWTIAWRSDVPTSYQSAVRPEPGNLELHDGVLGAAHGGNQYAELDSDWNGHTGTLNDEPASTVISQTITTIPGATYSVDYWFAARPNTPASDNIVEARFNGVLLDTAGPLAGGSGNLTAGDWHHRGPVVFVATSTSAVVSFTDAGTANSLGSFIDDVSVEQTICPAS